ncbi:MAG TPA: VWA domain-containing protein [Candidatus Nanoarchaeia archaeon]|nr:VWA domain-containing protein [Candidatus Nanoarchaeia archaeon]
MIKLTFENPIFLWYLLSIPLLIYTHFYLFRHAKVKAMQFANFEALKRVTGERLITKNIIILTLRVLTLTCVIMAATGAVFWYEGMVNENDFVIAIDVSASMTAQDVLPTRFDAAKNAALEFVDKLESKSNIGIITFSGTTLIETTLIDNKATVKKTIENLEITKTGGTDISGAIITGTNILLSSEKGKAIILITDGSNTVGAFIEGSVENSIEYAQKNHVIVHAIGVGSESGPIGYLPEYYNISAMYNENTLLKISNSTGGYYFKAMDEATMSQAYKEISRTADKGFIPVKLSHGLILTVLILLFLEWGLISTRFRRIP